MARIAKKEAENLKFGAVGESAIPTGFKRVSVGIPLRQPGDILTGKYTGKGSCTIKGKKCVTYKVVDTETGAEREVAASSQIDVFFGGIKTGATVFIRRLGKVAGGKGGAGVNTYEFGVK